MNSRLGLVILGLMLFASPLFAEDSTAFEISSHTSHGLWLRGGVGYSRNYNLHLAEGQSEGEFKWNGGLVASGYWLQESKHWQTGLLLSSSTDFNRLYSFWDYDLEPSHYLEISRQSNYSLSQSLDLQSNGHYYPFTIPVCLTGCFLFRGSYRGEEYTGHNEAHTYSQSTHAWDSRWSMSNELKDSDNFRGAIQFGIGYGKVKDASTEIALSSLEQSLNKSGIISGSVSKQARNKISALLYKTGARLKIKQQPNSSDLLELENILSEDGILKNGNLDHHDLEAVTEPYLGGHSLHREQGWFAGLHIYRERSYSSYNSSYIYVTPENEATPWSSASYSSTDYYDYENYQTAYGSYAEYHLPINRKWQIDSDFNFWYYKDNSWKHYLPSLRCQAIYLPDSPWLFSFMLQHTINQLQFVRSSYYITKYQTGNTLVGITAQYRLNARLLVDLQASYLEKTTRYKYSNLDGLREQSHQRSFEILLGLEYNLSGRQSSPFNLLPSLFSGWPVLNN
jgi:hypothetical protein